MTRRVRVAALAVAGLAVAVVLGLTGYLVTRETIAAPATSLSAGQGLAPTQPRARAVSRPAATTPRRRGAERPATTTAGSDDDEESGRGRSRTRNRSGSGDSGSDDSRSGSGSGSGSRDDDSRPSGGGDDD